MLSRVIRLTSCAVILMGGLTLGAPAAAQVAHCAVHDDPCRIHVTCCFWDETGFWEGCVGQWFYVPGCYLA